MAMEKIGDGLKKFLLVGIGAAAITVEKSQQMVDELVKKGEITVEQGKELNKELQHNVKKTLDAHKVDAETIEEKIAKMSAEEIELVKKAIKNAEGTASKMKEKIAEASEAIEAEAEAAEAEKNFEEDLKRDGYMVSDEE